MGPHRESVGDANPYLAHRSNYTSLISRFCLFETRGRDFVRYFQRRWKEDRDAQWARKGGWDEPHDERLQAALQRGEITRDEFLMRWNELWGVQSQEEAEFLNLLDQIFSACDSFGDDPRLGATYDENRLRTFVAQKFGAYFLSLSNRTAASR